MKKSKFAVVQLETNIIAYEVENEIIINNKTESEFIKTLLLVPLPSIYQMFKSIFLNIEELKKLSIISSVGIYNLNYINNLKFIGIYNYFILLLNNEICSHEVLTKLFNIPKHNVAYINTKLKNYLFTNEGSKIVRLMEMKASEDPYVVEIYNEYEENWEMIKEVFNENNN